jgi:hypothetical protein
MGTPKFISVVGDNWKIVYMESTLMAEQPKIYLDG